MLLLDICDKYLGPNCICLSQRSSNAGPRDAVTGMPWSWFMLPGSEALRLPQTL